MTFKKTISVSLPHYIWETYFQDYKANRSDYIIEMFMKGILVETEKLKGNENKIVELIKQVRELENINSDLKHELEIVKSRVITQEMREAERKLIRDKKEAEKQRILAEKEAKRIEDEERRNKEKMVDAIRLSGVMEMVGRNDNRK